MSEKPLSKRGFIWQERGKVVARKVLVNREVERLESRIAYLQAEVDRRNTLLRYVVAWLADHGPSGPKDAPMHLALVEQIDALLSKEPDAT